MSEQTLTIHAPVVFEQSGSLYTNSLSIATCFKKRHDVVLRDIRNLIADCPADFGLHNFVESSYTNSQGKEQPLYNLTFDGFILLAMGYTGPGAIQIKLLYIAEFNQMRALLAKKQIQAAGKPLLSPEQRAKLKALVDAKMSAYPAAIQGKARAELWTRFNRHFQIAAYNQLDPAKLPDAESYIIDLKLKATAKYDDNPVLIDDDSQIDKDELIHQLKLLNCHLYGRAKGYREAMEIMLAHR